MAKKSDKFIYIPKTGKIKIRFVGEQIEMFQYFNKSYFNGNVTSPFSALDQSPSSPEQNVFIMEEDNGDAAYTRSKRVVSLVIDRSDERVKAFVCPISAWNLMTEHSKDNDFEVWRTGHRLETRYFAEPLGLSEISEGQQEIISAISDSFTFADIFIKNKWEVVNEIVERIENRWEILDFSSMSDF